MNVYKFTSWAVGYTQYPWVGEWGPLVEMPFFNDFPPALKEMIKKSWEVNRSAPGMSIDRGGKEWSDVIGCGGGSPSYFVSERILKDLADEGIPIFRATEMPVYKNFSHALRLLPRPRYYVLEAEPGIQIRMEPVPVDVQLAASREVPPRWVSPFRVSASLDSWNGSDLFSPSSGLGLTSVYCTDRIKDLSEKRGWTNVSFDPVELD